MNAREWNPSVLIVEDQPYGQDIQAVLSEEGFAATIVKNGREFRSELAKGRPDVVLMDLSLPEFHNGEEKENLGQKLLNEARDKYNGIPIIVVTGVGKVPEAVKAIKSGAIDFFEKPVNFEKLVHRVRYAAEHSRLYKHNEQLIERTRKSEGFIVESSVMKEIWEQIKTFARTKARIFLSGEPGTGKSMLAYIIHRLSPVSKGKIVVLDCAAITSNLAESKLYGHVRGAFTGAISDRTGVFEDADGGTLFLDEIGDLPDDLQSNLLTAIQEGVITRVGTNYPTPVEVRLIMATNKPIKKYVAEGRFRKDLYDRLGNIRIHIPPLRERPEDIRAIALSKVSVIAQRIGVPERELPDEAIKELEEYPCPKNVRDIENTLEYVLALQKTGPITSEEIRNCLCRDTKSGVEEPVFALDDGNKIPKMSFDELVSQYERKILLKTLSGTNNNVAETSRLLKLTRPRIYRLFQQLKIDPNNLRGVTNM